MSTTASTGVAQLLGPAEDRVHNKTDNSVRAWYGQADLYRLTPPLRGYDTVVISTINDAVHIEANGAPSYGVETLIWGLEGNDLLFDGAEDIGGGWGTATAAEALAEAGYQIT